MSETRLVLIRHGHSTSQADGVVSGHSRCGGLSPHGQRQAELLAERLRRTKELGDADLVFTSLLPRAQMTADAVRAVIGGSLVPECSFCELHPGDAEGMTWAAMVEKWPAVGDKDDPFRRRLPNMETWSELAHRVGVRLRSLAEQRAGQTSVVVTSGGVVGASFHALGDLPLSKVVDLTRSTENTSLTEWVHYGGRWQLVRFNDAAHLR